MKRASFALIAAAAAGAGLALTACNSDPLSSCHLAALDFNQTRFMMLAVKDSATIRAVTISDCAKIGRAVDFSIKNSALVSLRVLSDTSAMIKGVAVGETLLYLQPRDYHQNRDSIVLNIIGENP